MAIAVTPASGSITAKKTVVRVNVSGQDPNDTSTYTANTALDPDPYPIMTENRFYLTFETSGQDTGKSYVFNVDSAGDHTFNNYVFPAAGTWTVRLSNARTDASIETISVVVS